jgi:hypothetical protein
VNPDNFKRVLVEHHAQTFGAAPTPQAVHAESSMLTRRLWARLESSMRPVLVDRRLGSLGDVSELVESAQAHRKTVQLYDIDAPFLTSCLGVLTRSPGGADAIPPFETIANGFREASAERVAVIMRLLDLQRGR